MVGLSGPPGDDAQQQAVVVLGAHRSGTSLVTELVSRMGFSLGREVIGEHVCNVNGLFENASIVALNEALLADAGSAWFDHGVLDAERLIRFRGDWVQRVEQVIAEQFPEGGNLVIKDPRICRFFPVYEAALERRGYTVRCLFQHRHPVDVAASLYRRDGLPTLAGLRLWLAHTFQALNDCDRGGGILTMAYEDLLKDPGPCLDSLGRWLFGDSRQPDRESRDALIARVDPALATAGEPIKGVSGEAKALLDIALGTHEELLSGRALRSPGSTGQRARAPGVVGQVDWLRHGTVAVTYAGPGDRWGVFQELAERNRDSGIGTLLIRDGEQREQDAEFVSQALGNDAGLFFNRSMRGESSSLVRGISLAARRDLLLVTGPGRADYVGVLRGLDASQRGAKDDVLVMRNAGPGTNGKDGAVLALYLPWVVASRHDPWALINGQGDALQQLLQRLRIAAHCRDLVIT